MRICVIIFLSSSLYCLYSCTGTRNLYSSSPFISPVPLDKGASEIEGNYFTHTRNQNNDSGQLHRDNSFGLGIFYMIKTKTALTAFGDIKNERDRYHDSIALRNDPTFNGGFDSSNVVGKRYTLGAGIEFFPGGEGKTIKSFAILIDMHLVSINESGSSGNRGYDRFFKMDQLSLSLQQNFLFTVKDNWKIGWITRLTLLNNFKAFTNYSSPEKLTTGLRGERVNIIFCPTGLYTEYKPSKTLPISLNGQFFNDLSLIKHPLAKYELGRVYIKGTGLSVGVKYLLK